MTNRSEFWMLGVLQDLKSFSETRGLPKLSTGLEHLTLVAKQEISAKWAEVEAEAERKVVLFDDRVHGVKDLKLVSKNQLQARSSHKC